ncbi:MAG TPA: membrane protein insertion efficiency factor YidD [Rhizomicrobium sp.]|nr:membrane protein insertion efficiency factor YidD [Rhizomicrobium sp.]
MLVAPIRFYQLFLGPLFPPACRFEPTCSVYAIEALRTHGAWKGSLLTLRRLSRCHPIRWLGGSAGFDPVPPAGDAKAVRLGEGGLHECTHHH